MAEPTEDLWPSNLADEPTDRAPLQILREQAARLAEKTSNVVEAVVTADPLPDGEHLDIRFCLVAPMLGGYEYVMLRARQPVVNLYPVRLEFEDNTWVANEERGFKQYLERLFNSARTRQIISRLMAQSKTA